MALGGRRGGQRVCAAAGVVVAVVLGTSGAGAQVSGGSDAKNRWIDRADAVCRKAESRRVKVSMPPSLVGAVAVVTQGRVPNTKQHDGVAGILRGRSR